MLWSDPENTPHPQLRATQLMLRRLGWVLAVTALVGAVLASRAG